MAKRITIQQVNKQKIRPAPYPEEKKPIKGFDVCQEVYSNIALIAKKKSGKTEALFHLLKQCIGKGTKEIIIFCRTLYKDKAWKRIREWLDKEEIEYQGFTSIYEDDENQIDILIKRLNEEAEEREYAEQEKQPGEPAKATSQNCDDILSQLQKHNNILGQYLADGRIGDDNIDKPKKERKSKFLAPEYFIILDDIGDQLKTTSLKTLLNWNRHYKAKVIVSTQYLNHLLPDSRKMMDLFMIFRGQTEKKLNELYADSDISIPFELFYKLYKHATSKKFSFLWIDTNEQEYRRNFSDKFILPDSDDDELE